MKVHEAASELARLTPEILSHPEVARAIEQELIRAVVACLDDARVVSPRGLNRQAIMRRFHQVIEASQDEPLYMPDLCAAVSVPERTLRSACFDQLGMGPIRYLWLRRMYQAKRALTLADATARTVTQIANDFGFAELGRFAVTYRALFGESPSMTLRRPAGG